MARGFLARAQPGRDQKGVRLAAPLKLVYSLARIQSHTGETLPCSGRRAEVDSAESGQR
jgi:hypothetical protein